MTEEQTAGQQSPVLYEVDGHGVAVITWNRPERRNMWTSAMEDAFYSALDRATAELGAEIARTEGMGVLNALLDDELTEDEAREVRADLDARQS